MHLKTSSAKWPFCPGGGGGGGGDELKLPAMESMDVSQFLGFVIF